MNITRELMSGSRWEIQLNSQFIQKKMLQNIDRATRQLTYLHNTKKTVWWELVSQPGCMSLAFCLTIYFIPIVLKLCWLWGPVSMHSSNSRQWRLLLNVRCSAAAAKLYMYMVVSTFVMNYDVGEQISCETIKLRMWNFQPWGSPLRQTLLRIRV